MSVIEKVRKQVPLIHHLTNQVVMNFTANGLLAFGGSPVMAKEPKEATEMAAIADGVLINIGTMTEQDLKAFILAGKKANERNIPVVLDPVGVSATPFRKQAVKKLLNEISFTAIKGNAGEIAYLAGVTWKTKGVESADGDTRQLVEIASQVARKYDTIAIITGKVDMISDGEVTRQNESGHEMLTKITGAGCLLGSIITACLAVGNSPLDDSFQAVQFYGEAAERAAKHPFVKGTGTFIPHFIDELQN